MIEPRPCVPCGGSGYETDHGYGDKRCGRCKGHGRMCIDCYGHLDEDAEGDIEVNRCTECAETDRLDRKACAADDERKCHAEDRS